MKMKIVSVEVQVKIVSFVYAAAVQKVNQSINQPLHPPFSFIHFT